MKLEKIMFGDTPLSANKWRKGEVEIPGHVIGEIHFHRNGSWNFKCIFEKEPLQVYAIEVDGDILNFTEYIGELD